jgi:TolB-like protein/Tfp pilus assembly protein PilF
MAEARVQRRLAAILAADVVGYSRLVEQDETGTLAAFKERQQEILNPLTAQHQGRIVKMMGDGVLVEFASAVNAVACAAELQKRWSAANAGVADDRRIDLRVGINLGDVVVEGDDLYGDGVIIAVRLQAMAEPGGICLAASVHDQVENKLPLAFEALGPCMVKNIAKPVPAVRVRMESREPGRSAPHQRAEVKPSIAVLPFANMSGDPDQQYFSDGITEDIITELSRFRQLHVLARNLSFRYRGEDVDVIRVGRELGVQYLVEGSVRRLGERIRITAQLIDTGSGHHVWAERFDRNQDELFAVQDQVVRTVVGTLVGRLQAADVERVKRKPPASLAAYDYVLRADALPFDNPEGEAEARRLYESAIELDPGYARAYALLAALTQHQWLRDTSGSDTALDRAFGLAKKAVALDENDSACQACLGLILLLRQSHELAEHHYLKALELNRNSSMVLANLGYLYAYLGKPAQGIAYFEEAKLLDPFFEPTWYWPMLGVAYFTARRYDEAIATLDRSPTMPFWALGYLAACHALAGRTDSARYHAAEVVRIMPDFSVTRFAAKEPFKRATDREHLLDGLRRARLPE